MFTDAIGDMLTRIRNGNEAKHEHVSFPHSKLKVAIVEILKREGFVQGFTVSDEGAKKKISVQLKYHDGHRVINRIERISKPGRRVYVPKKEIPKVLSGLGISIITTPKGVMTGHRARLSNVGGEYICKIW